MNNDQIQQGDVLLQRIKTLPEGVNGAKRDNGDIVLAYGEVTGHAHRISETKNKIAAGFLGESICLDSMFFEKDGKFYLKNDFPVIVSHEEHKPITIEPGVWEIGQVREKDWLSGMVRQVID